MCKSGICFATSPEWMEARGANLSGIAVDAASGIGYVSTWSSPAALLAVNLTLTLTLTTTLTLNLT